jgi:Recombination endonuclease VII.
MVESLRANPERLERRRKYKLNHHLTKTFGITIEAFNAILEAQGGKCKICRRKVRKAARLYVDHDHKTGRVRGLLCPSCNMGIGCFQDNPKLLKAAQRYVEET